MSNVFKTQSLLTLVLETGYDLSTASVKQINYTKPNGKIGFFPGTISGTTLIYSLQNGDIDQAGQWRFQAYIEVAGLKGMGDVATVIFENPL